MLRELSAEASLLACMDPLPIPGTIQARQRIAQERDGTPRAGRLRLAMRGHRI